MSFCKTCKNLLRPKRNAVSGEVLLHCNVCSDVPDAVQNLIDDPDFLLKLKNLFRSGRAEKQLKTLSRSLSVPELKLHDTLKTLDDSGQLPYGYYDKIERTYVRTHVADEIPDDLMIDMVKQSYGYDIFGAKGLTNYISLGKNTSVRKVLQSLHSLRKKGLIRGHKRGVNWLWRLPKLGEDPAVPFFPKKDHSDVTTSAKDYKVSRSVRNPETEKNDADAELEEVEDDSEDDYDEDEEEQDDSKMVYFADPEEDENGN